MSSASEELLFEVQGTMRILRRHTILCAAVVAFSIAGQAVSAEAVSEHKLKAAFLYNFTKFVEWPAERFATPSDPLVIGLIADDEMVTELVAIVADRQVNGRALVVRRIAGSSDLQTIHMLFVSSQKQVKSGSLRERAENAAVLVVSDEKNCRLQGGSICFIQQGDKLRFEINMDTAEHSQLKISAQLQKLAVAVNKGT